MSKIIGIDLGTTYSAIAQLDDLGNPEVLASTDSNKKITASAVYIKDENVIVGDKALDALAATPKNVVTETKRQMENDIDQWYRDVGEIFHEGHEHLGDFLSEVLHRNPHPNPNIPTHEYWLGLHR